MKKFLHVGCGDNKKEHTTPVFMGNDWEEVRLDIDKNANPDIIASMTDLNMIGDEEYDGIFSSHNIEHIYPHQVDKTLREFNRVLKRDGEAYIICPDLKVIAKQILDDKFVEPLYESPAGPITPLDMLFGLRSAVAEGNEYMAHKCAFTSEILQRLLLGAGFGSVAAATTSSYNIIALALKPKGLADLAIEKLHSHNGSHGT